LFFGIAGGWALALFFGIAGGLTAIGPIAGGYLIEWTWRAIFWINVPVALIALTLIAISKPGQRIPPGPDGLPRPGLDRRRCRAELGLDSWSPGE
jgi:MFS family permease